MIGYINQIDSLNRLTAYQKEVIADVTQKYHAASQQISNLSEEKNTLTEKVTLAAQARRNQHHPGRQEQTRTGHPER